ncbi:hypothetical protein Pla108_22860 [Botrimarina colliarenosi]|uniref:Uncharacterized protein n=1 Tax=Botrimarina colliarenosi TaxID=2528001 RepID=A0A5C6AET8_9BACT|nr:host attachment protein [Botrimarina colliarenosi]TWT98129.1 hypothetical protein Pla108_22860 [Botrimarina colliarenosi]
MSEPIQVTDGTYLVAADGSHAKCYEVWVRDQLVALRALAVMEPKDLLSQGPSGSRPPEQTDSQTDEATFAKQLGNALNAMATAGDFDQLVVCADSPTLGQLREVMSAETKRRGCRRTR